VRDIEPAKLDAKTDHNAEMNERLNLGSGGGSVDVCLWVNSLVKHGLN
jgi:hypothetical protein